MAIQDSLLNALMNAAEELPITPVLSVFRDVVSERERQHVKWGQQDEDPFTWLAILMEEVGEASKAALHVRFGGPEAAGLRTEVVHVMALACAMLECLDRGEWAWPDDVAACRAGVSP